MRASVPFTMVRGSTVTDLKFSYFTPDGSNLVYSYEWSAEKWKELCPCPYQNSSLVIINGELTAVGGWDGRYYTNRLVTLQQKRRRQWVNEYPSMNIARSDAAVVSTADGEFIVVLGGHEGDGSFTAAVELFQVSNRRWHKLQDLPHHLPHPSGTTTGDKLHVIGTDGEGYSCSLRALLSIDGPITPQSIPQLISWTSLPPLPVTTSTAATLFAQLVLVGGWKDFSPVDSIHQLLDGQWVKIGSMTCARELCSVVSPSPDKLMIVGGVRTDNSVDECIAV